MVKQFKSFFSTTVKSVNKNEMKKRNLFFFLFKSNLNFKQKLILTIFSNNSAKYAPEIMQLFIRVCFSLKNSSR